MKSRTYIVRYIMKEYGVKNSPSDRVSSMFIKAKSVNDARNTVFGIGRFLKYYVDIIDINPKK